MYFVQFTKSSFKDLKNNDKLKEKIQNDLSTNPSHRSKIFGRSKTTGLLYFEKRYYYNGGIRVYFTIQEGTIIITEVEYEGEIEIHRISNKNTQNKIGKSLGVNTKGKNITRTGRKYK